MGADAHDHILGAGPDKQDGCSAEALGPLASKQLVYLDTNVWNGLTDGSVPLTEDLLVEAYRAGLIEVVGSLSIEEELAGAARLQRTKYIQMRKVFERLTGPRSLRPLNERHPAEARYGGLLPVPNRYNSKSRRKALRRYRRRLPNVMSVADDVWRAKQRDLNLHVTARRRVTERVADEYGETRLLAGDWLSDTRIADWVNDILAEARTRELLALDGANALRYERLPSAWLLTTFRMARIVRVHVQNRKLQPSDLHDAEHAAAGGYYDLLVTADKEFRATLDLFPRRPFAVVDPIDLASILQDRIGHPVRWSTES